MKRFLALSLSAALFSTVLGCTTQSTPATSASSASLAPSTAQSAGNASSQSAMDMAVVADAAMYRGTITSITESPEGQILMLTQAKGTNFGAASLAFLIDSNTKCSFDSKQLAVGGYLEVLYGAAPGTPLETQKTYTAIAANLYRDTDSVNFNGIIQEIKALDDKAGNGSITLRDMANDQVVVFHYGVENTQFYLDLAQLKTGDALNIFHTGVYTMSLPPQGTALEVRKFFGEISGS